MRDLVGHALRNNAISLAFHAVFLNWWAKFAMKRHKSNANASVSEAMMWIKARQLVVCSSGNCAIDAHLNDCVTRESGFFIRASWSTLR